MTNFQKVKNFMQTFGQEVKSSPSFSSAKINELRYNLIKEELDEFKQALDNDGSELLEKSEFEIISLELSKLKEIIRKSSFEEIDRQIKTLESKSEFYVERRMNKSIQSLMTGKGIDDVFE